MKKIYKKQFKQFLKNENSKNWYERNSSTIQFYLTIAALLVTVFFSARTMLDTRKSFEYARLQDSLKDVRDSLKDIRDSNNLVAQNKVTTEQIDISKKQNEFIEKQLDGQLRAIKMQNEIDKPYFTIDSIKFVNRNNIDGEFYTTFINKGKRPVHIQRVLSFIYNSKIPAYHAANMPGKFKLGGGGGHTIALVLPKSIAFDKNTILYSKIFYTDMDNHIKTDEIFWIHNTDRWPRFMPAPVLLSTQKLVIKAARELIIDYDNFINNPNLIGQPKFKD
ncbi:hypothetical protein DBR40_05375 [Pedobacter sp. KBW01]|uniref:hypothetical protein n=1 Tax=Pedobacter sp. KBW01 TaxID=2153364 RepID=UPI000F5A8C81|nr:hypothetical protein [Pedobacter sp. KBW01]RQO79152.1 hypothetical protein DBR40_05375 [Pedobacter sp. KBW01]